MEPVPFHLRTLTLKLDGQSHLQERTFTFLTSASHTTLVSVILPRCPRPVHAAVHDLSPFISLAFVELSLPLLHEDLATVFPLLATLSRQLDTVPASVRHLTLRGKTKDAWRT